MYALSFKTEYSNSKESLIGKVLATQPCAPRTIKEQNKEKSYILFYDEAIGNRKIIILLLRNQLLVSNYSHFIKFKRQFVQLFFSSYDI